MARDTVSARGRKVLPSTPCRVKSGVKTRTMIVTAKRIGRPTSAEARATTWTRGSAGSACRSRRSTFSTMTMVPSTSMPMAMARPPRLIKLAVIPSTPIPRVAKSSEKGMARATTALGRRPPMNTRSTRATRPTPCTRASVTVATHRATRVA